MKNTDLSQRLAPLSNGQPGLRSGLQTAASVPPETQGRAIIDFTASDETVDRYEETISASGWKLEAYRRNPVFQNAHQCGDVLFTLGRALVTEVRGGRLFQRIEFAVEANPVARVAYDLYRGKYLNAVSVGFIPLCWQEGGPGDLWRRRYLEQELVEVSAVGVPANPNALALALKSGALRRRDLLRALEYLRQLPPALKDPAHSRRIGWLRDALHLQAMLCAAVR